jgi:hypothetical protein
MPFLGLLVGSCLGWMADRLAHRLTRRCS